MNNKRRIAIAKQVELLENLKEQLGTIADIKAAIGELQLDEQDSYDNLPFSLQQSDSGHAAGHAADALAKAVLLADSVQMAMVDTDAIGKIIAALKAAREVN